MSKMRWFVVGIGTLFATGVAVYALWKPNTTSADLLFLPQPVVTWLDDHGDLRTMLMTIAVCSIPGMAMFRARFDSRRRAVLLALMTVLLGLEWGQRWIPTRGFSIADLLYTVLGAGCAELMALLTQLATLLKRSHFGENDWE
ncbi:MULTISPECIES: hypothetical protein [Pseudomonadati]|uniref:hypothetical protein n=1 Tax=Pseudomonadati TaxID=3379134 RepID=UPI0032656727